jgi:hypothetical protein
MAHRRLQSSRLALLVGLFSAFLLAPAPRVSAEPIDPQANSLQSAVDSFVAYLKTETNAAMPRRLKQGRGSAEPSLEEAAVSSWAKIERSARDALAEIDAWPRTQSLPGDDSEIHV